jgi:hypothetical protein
MRLPRGATRRSAIASPQTSASTDVNFVDSCRVPCVFGLTICSALSFHLGGFICNRSFVSPAPRFS